MRTPSRGISAALAALVGLVPLSLAVSAAPAQAADTDIRINEIITNSATHADAIELTNIGDAPVDVSGWIVKDNNDTRTFAIPGGTTVAPDAYVTVTVDDGTATGFGLGNGDAARIYLPGGTTLVDGHTFPSHSAPSWSRCPDGTGDFVQANSETLGAANDCPSVDDLVINEVESNGDATNGDWIELGNPTSVPLDASGLVVKDNDDTHAVTVAAGTTVPAGGFAAVVTENAAKTGPVGAFGLGSADSARLFHADGTTPIADYTWTAHATTTYGRCPDLEGDLVTTGAGTFGTANSCPLPAEIDAVNINEVESNGDATDWIELKNTGAAPIDVSGWILRDNDDTSAATIPAATTITAGGYVAIDTNVAAAHTTNFGLGGADRARLFLPDGITAVDSYEWTAHAATTYGRCPDGTGDFVATTAGTRAAANACPADADPSTIKLNEVESNGDAVGDWVEITNTGDAPVDVSGWKVRDAAEDHPFAVIPAGTVVQPGGYFWLYTEFPPPGFGLGVDDTVTLFQADGTSVVDSYTWSGGHAATTYGRCPDGTGEWQVTTVATKGTANACSPIRVNEIESSDAAAGPDWVELVNLSAAPIDVAGWVIKDSGDAEPTTLPAPSVVPANGHLVVDTLTAGLGGTDAVRLFDPTDKLIDSFDWTVHATQTYGRCKDGVGAFVDNVAPTPGAVNDCPGLDTAAWPGSQTVATADLAETFGQDASGLAFDPADPNTLWVAQNKAGTLTKLVKDGATWVPAEGWSPGRNPRYNDGTGAPDTEGITFGPDGAVYLASERNNEASGVSLNKVLRYEPGTSMNATDEWALNGLLPALGANLGLEGVTWVPDADLVGGGLVDQSTTQAYDPADYPAHGTGLYVVAVEGTGLLYVLALDQTAAVQESAHLVATIDPQLKTNAGPPGVMDVVWDPELERLWAVCDDSCDGVTVNLALAAGEWDVVAAYDRPVGMPNLNNEGFALAPQSTCVDGAKAVLWSDDGDTDGHSLRTGTFPCTEVPDPTPVANDVAPRITGTAKVGATLTGSAGTWTPAPATTKLQWLANDAPITGATGSRLKLGPSLYGKRISLRVRVTADGHLDGVATSAQTTPVARGVFAVARAPRILGTPRVGRTLTVQVGVVTPAPTTVTYAWYVDGKRVSTAARLTLLRRWAGDRVAVKVTYARASYTTMSRNTTALRVSR
ncbi:MAG TPA: lamin tail domain-containing protein [Nocardioides sp.]|nr:lamin tail domain-containing protein [Nocardioides sp.]